MRDQTRGAFGDLLNEQMEIHMKPEYSAYKSILPAPLSSFIGREWEVAECLVINLRTGDTHLTSIYGKPGVSSRSAATRSVLEHHLV